MVFLTYAAFLFVMLSSMSGWGSLALPGSCSWSEKLGAGTIVTFLLVAAAGWAGLLVPGILWLVPGAGMLLWARPGRFGIPSGWLLISACGALVLPLVLLPPVSRDAMIHHLFQARLWLEAGRIVRPEWSEFFSYPYLTESLYTLAGGTFGLRVSRAVSFIGYLAACSALAGYFLRRSGWKKALLALLVLLSIPEFFRNASWSYSDSFLIFFSLLAYLQVIREEPNGVLAMVWASAAACCKYNGFLVLFSVFTVLLVNGSFRGRFLRPVLAAVFLSAWWALPNLIQWGNPVYPLMRGIFGPEASPVTGDYFAITYQSTTLHSILDYLLLPVRMSLHGQWNNPALFDGASGPLLLAGTILAIPVMRRRRRMLLLPLMYILLALIFKGSAIRTRYLLPGMVMLTVPVTQGLWELLTRGRRYLRLAVAVLIGVCALWSAARVVQLYDHERPWTAGSDEEYLSARSLYYDFFRKCDLEIASGDTTLMVNITRPYYYPGYAILGDSRVPLDLLGMLWSGMDADGIADSLAEDGITHLASDMFLTSINLVPELDPEELQVWRRFVSRRTRPVLTFSNFVLLELIPGR